MDRLRQTDLLPLDAPERVISWRTDSGKIRRHTFRRITAADNELYESRCFVNSGSAIGDPTESLLMMYEECATQAEGYPVKGGQPIISIPNWKRRVPATDRVLAACHIHGATGAFLESESPEILSVAPGALWTERAPGEMRQFQTVHHFALPLIEHEAKLQRYREQHAARLEREEIGTGLDLYRVLTGIYDELILSVEGYSVGGQPLRTAEQISREMDAGHKKIAALRLLVSAEEIENSQRGEA